MAGMVNPTTGEWDPDMEDPNDPAPDGRTAPAPLTMDGMIARDRDSWERELKLLGGNLYDPSDLDGVIRNLSYSRNNMGGAAGDAATWIANQKQIYDTRRAPNAPSQSGGSGGGGSSSGGYPYPERITMPTPTRPNPYSSTYQTQTAQPFTGYGQDERNRILQAILNNPDTMGETQQAQLFEQQKELLNAQRSQQQGQLQQSLAQRGLSGIGGASLAGQADIGYDFTGQLLGAQRDVAVKAAAQNRTDRLAALEMQQAVATGDYQKMMGIYEANQNERKAQETFLQQAHELTQTGTLAYNAQDLNRAVAQQNEISDFYRFLEMQRQNINMQNLDNARFMAGSR